MTSQFAPKSLEGIKREERTMKFNELKTLVPEELKKKLSELRMELLKENAQIANKTNPKNPGKVRDTKKNIARILSILHKEGKSKT